ncbi:unnamed protein product [Cladocopium goreaui]|uniref:Pentacotripeptide-repeat region of PRORP domain-containing protein n=1 Tax=Cladocopium goreaui TaxID=2562237 RepID=A0A9P1BZZ5_9DINO|nr:unnamed protein product [Cladocopium goreaui]
MVWKQAFRLRAAAARVGQFGQAKKWQHAVALLHALKVPPDLRFLGAVLVAVERGSAWQYAAELLAESVRRRWELDAVAYGTVALSLERSSQRRFSTQLLQSLAVTDATHKAFNVALLGAALQRGRELMLLMQRQRVAPDIVSYNSLINICDREHQWSQSLQLLALMRRRYLAPNLVSFGSAISACAKGAQWPRSLILMEQLRRQCLQPNFVVLSACMDACASGRQWIHALRLMQSSGVSPNLAMFNTLLHGLAANSQWLQVLEMFKLLQVQSGDDGVLQVAYCAVLVACATSTQWSQALNFLQRMRLASLPIQLPAWHAVQSSLASTWRWQQALQILTEIKADEVQPDVVNYLTVADACTRGGQPERMFPQLPAMRGQVLSTLLWRRKGIGGEEPPSDIAFSGLAVELLRVMSSGPDQRKGSLQRLHDSKQAEVRYWSCLSRAGSSKGWADHILGSFTTQGNPVAVHDK